MNRKKTSDIRKWTRIFFRVYILISLQASRPKYTYSESKKGSRQSYHRIHTSKNIRIPGTDRLEYQNNSTLNAPWPKPSSLLQRAYVNVSRCKRRKRGRVMRRLSNRKEEASPKTVVLCRSFLVARRHLDSFVEFLFVPVERPCTARR